MVKETLVVQPTSGGMAPVTPVKEVSARHGLCVPCVPLPALHGTLHGITSCVGAQNWWTRFDYGFGARLSAVIFPTLEGVQLRLQPT